jgi:sulfatase modifying factor 1
MTLVKTLIAIAAIGVGSQAFGKTKTATLKAYGLHANFLSAITGLGEKTFFTTYDGENGWPLNEQKTYSGELKPSYAGSSIFKTDYLAARPSSEVVYEHGTISLNMPTADTDENGVHDWLQKDMAVVNAAFTGSSSVHWLAPGHSSGSSIITGRINRSAGSVSGTYSMEYTIPSLRESSNLHGVLHIGYWEGTITYEGDNYSGDIKTLNPQGGGWDLSGSAGYSKPTENQLQLDDIQLTDGSNVLRIAGSTLERSGNSYSANMKVIDGNPDTSWSDYIDWHVVVTDINDADSGSLDGWNYHVWPWVYNHADKDWLYYYCGSNGWAVWRHKDKKWYSFDEAGKAWIVLPGQEDVQEEQESGQDDQQDPAENNAGDTYIVQGASNMEMIWVVPGTFTMGSPTSEEGRSSDENQHEVTLTKGFWLGKYEVTQAQYEAIMTGNAGGSSATPSRFSNNPNRPVETVSWNDVQVFLTRLNAAEEAAGRLPAGMAYQLPTESEWEYACRAGTTTAFSWGDTASSTQANFYPYGGAAKGPKLNRTTDVGQYAANPWGFHDMHGNVLELCADWYGNYPTVAVNNPVGPADGSYRVFRGGAWLDSALDARSAYRARSGPAYSDSNLGFRLSLRPASQ